jgi:mRNA interferase MazF
MNRGEIWMADLGYTAKVRPVLILSIDYNDEERAVVTYIPRTTSVWSEGRFDVSHKARGMKDGAFAVQLVGTAPDAKFMRRINEVSAATMGEIESALKLWLGLPE